MITNNNIVHDGRVHICFVTISLQYLIFVRIKAHVQSLSQWSKDNVL